MRPGRPPPRLHRPDALNLTRGADHRDSRLGRQAVTGEIQFGEGHGLVVEAAGGLEDLLGRGGQMGDALPRLIGVVARTGHHSPVDIAGRQSSDQQCRNNAAILRSVRTGAGPHCIGIGHCAEPVTGRASGDLPVGIAGIRPFDRGSRHLVGGRTGHHRRRRPQCFVPESAAGAEVPAQRAAGAHLDQLRQVGVLVDADRVGRAGRHAGAALNAAFRVDHASLQFKEPGLAWRLLDPVDLLADPIGLHRTPPGLVVSTTGVPVPSAASVARSSSLGTRRAQL